MVKGAVRNAAAASTSTPQPLPTMQAGQNPSDPLTLLNSHMGHGVMAGFNPFEGLGVNPNDPNMVRHWQKINRVDVNTKSKTDADFY